MECDVVADASSSQVSDASQAWVAAKAALDALPDLGAVKFRAAALEFAPLQPLLAAYTRERLLACVRTELLPPVQTCLATERLDGAALQNQLRSLSSQLELVRSIAAAAQATTEVEEGLDLLVQESCPPAGLRALQEYMARAAVALRAEHSDAHQATLRVLAAAGLEVVPEELRDDGDDEPMESDDEEAEANPPAAPLAEFTAVALEAANCGLAELWSDALMAFVKQAIDQRVQKCAAE